MKMGAEIELLRGLLRRAQPWIGVGAGLVLTAHEKMPSYPLRDHAEDALRLSAEIEQALQQDRKR